MENCCLCELSAGHVITRKYYEDDKWILVDCKTCKVPMLVYKAHVPYVYEILENIQKIFLENVPVKNHDNYWVDTKMRAIKTHFHCHYRKK